ncbi:Exc2 family lipoprotein [Buttiauxella agrestis]
MRNTLILIAIATTLVGCAKTAPMRHSYHYATHQSSELNGNLVSRPDATARLNLHVFEELYNSGKVDRAAGISEETALQKAELIKTANLGASRKSPSLMRHRPPLASNLAKQRMSCYGQKSYAKPILMDIMVFSDTWGGDHS